MHMVVEEVPEVGDKAVTLGIIVVGAEDGDQVTIVGECAPYTSERVGVHLDVRVHEHEDVARRSTGADVPRRCRPYRRGLVDQDDLARPAYGSPNGGKTALGRRAPIRCRNYHGKRRHGKILSWQVRLHHTQSIRLHVAAMEEAEDE